MGERQEEKELALDHEDVRYIANAIPYCEELKNPQAANILSFIISKKPDPARIQVFCETGTIATLRVFDGSVRHIFNKKLAI